MSDSLKLKVHSSAKVNNHSLLKPCSIRLINPYVRIVDQTLVSNEVSAVFEYYDQLSFNRSKFLRELIVITVTMSNFENTLISVED
jgi:hypothetical protein